MLDFNHILSTPGVDVQYFTGQGGIIGPIASVVIAGTAGVLTVTSSAASGGYQVGKAITVSGTLTAGTINGTADYTTPVTFYIIQVDSATSITISTTPGGAAVATTAGTATPGGVFTLSSQWQTWRKPRGVKNVYMIGVGGGSSGAVGNNTGATNAGGAGGGSGGQTCVWIPAFFVPDVLYIQCGAGGRQPTTLIGGQIQQGGGPTYVAIEPSSTLTANMTVLLANGGVAGAVTGGAVATLAGMPLAARGSYTFLRGKLAQQAVLLVLVQVVRCHFQLQGSWSQVALVGLVVETRLAALGAPLVRLLVVPLTISFYQLNQVAQQPLAPLRQVQADQV